jgi:hypothetical protein
VKLLVESEPEEENFLSDQHLACLISTVAASGTVLYHRVPTPSPLPLRVAKAGTNRLNKEITPLLPTGIGEQYSQTI